MSIEKVMKQLKNSIATKRTMTIERAIPRVARECANLAGRAADEILQHLLDAGMPVTDNDDARSDKELGQLVAQLLVESLILSLTHSLGKTQQNRNMSYADTLARFKEFTFLLEEKLEEGHAAK